MGMGGRLSWWRNTPVCWPHRTAGVAAVGLVIAGLAFFAPVLNGYFLKDDFTWIHEFYGFDWRRLGELLAGSWSRTSNQEYRPLWGIFFAADLDLWGAHPFPLHMTNIALHAAASVLVWRVAATARGGGRLAAALALARFVAAPVHEEPVAWISARGHILVTIFILSSLLLLGRYHARGGSRWYLASVGSALAAFGTEELSVALPPLLLLRDLVSLPRRGSHWGRLAKLHAPFWLLLVGYLGLRVAIFGMVARENTAPLLPQSLAGLYPLVRMAWLSAAMLDSVPPWLGLALVLLPAVLLAWPVVVHVARSTWSREETSIAGYIRAVIYFGVLWPLVAVAPLLPLMGAVSQRHFYLASVGVAVALGIAGAQAVKGRPRLAVLPWAAIGLLLVVHVGLLVRGVSAFAENGRLSYQLKHELEAQASRVATDPEGILVVIPEIPGNVRPFWEYALPLALDPLFFDAPPPQKLVSSFASCHCAPEEWLHTYRAVLDELAAGLNESVYVVAWDPEQGAFGTSVLDRGSFRAGGYAAREGPLVRARIPGQPSPVIPEPQLTVH